MLANVPNYMIYTAHLGVFIIILFIRFGALHLYETFSGHHVSKGNTEVLRIGSDLTLMGLGMFLGASVNNEFMSKLTLPYPFYLAGFAFVFVVNYCVFLSMADKDLPTVFRLNKKRFAFSLLIGCVTLNVYACVI